MIQKQRIKLLNRAKAVRSREFVVYWMQASQRAEYNHALEYAVRAANSLGKPLIVYFGLTEKYPEANARHYRFMLEGLKETQIWLGRRGIGMLIEQRSPDEGAIELSERACLLVVDRGYLRVQRRWRSQVAASVGCPVIQIEGDVVVPVEEASQKEEFSAATLRRKLQRMLDAYLVPLEETQPYFDSSGIRFDSFPVGDVDRALSKLNVDRSVSDRAALRGGTTEGKALLEDFMQQRLDRYGKERNDPARPVASLMSAYLHFGQISPLYIALRVLKSASPGRTAYLEELITRRELSMNFVHYNPAYDSFEGLPAWARKSLGEHARDARPHLYTVEQLEKGETADPYWNAAQQEMVRTGKMHGYMRMYWGKKILEWSETPKEAFSRALYLNNKYELDGRDPNGYTGVAWCFGKHDRPWRERPVFGKVRYMNARGLERKFDMDTYVRLQGGQGVVG